MRQAERLSSPSAEEGWTGKVICYLDFDGVLHDEQVFFMPDRELVMGTPGRILFEWQSILLRLLAPHRDVNIVLSTAWVRAKSFSYAKRRLCQELRERVIGATFPCNKIPQRDFERMPRGSQIWEDVKSRKPGDWFAIDDDGFGWPPHCRDRLIKTDGRRGLSDPAVQEKIQRRLNSTPNSTKQRELTPVALPPSLPTDF